MKVLFIINVLAGAANIGWAIFRIRDRVWGSIGLNTAVGILCLFVAAAILAFEL